MSTYRIVRHFKRKGKANEVISRGLEEADAKAWCSKPNSSSTTATDPYYTNMTKQDGAWFDGYEKENDNG